ncbi:MAG: hypothetical protein LBU62_10605 [Bacteroidales bacterium]|jgi:hypothetical protein|nr:hypothetical protein [Bacteroidales bacterium]
MAMFEYGIGGNVEKIDASEAIADIPHNRTLLVEKLTADDPVSPETAGKLETIEDVFAHFKPNIDVAFEDGEGQDVVENFRFKNVADFLIANMTKNSPFLKDLDNQKAFYNRMIKQLRSNKIMQRALQNPDARTAFVESLQALLSELESYDVKKVEE